MSIYQLSAKEIYDSYIGDITPPELLEQNREDLATRLRLEEDLEQEEAYHAADQMLAYARSLVEPGIQSSA
jgi:hypothetical protein